MSDRTMELGIVITADGKIAAGAARQVAQSFDDIGQSAKAAAARAKSAYDIFGLPRAPLPLAGQVREIEQASKQAAYAMRLLPAQMTDIAVGLSTGQSPFMVLMQQGGQLRDMFGGIGPAAKAVAGSIAGMINPFTVAAAAAVGLGYAITDGFSGGRDVVKDFTAASKEADEAFSSLGSAIKTTDFTALYKSFNEANVETRKLIASQVELRMELLRTAQEAARGDLAGALANIGHESSWMPGSDAIQSKILEQVDTLKIANDQRAEFARTMMALDAQTVTTADAFKTLREIIPATTKEGREFLVSLSKAVDAEMRLEAATRDAADALQKMQAAGGDRKIDIKSNAKAVKADVDELAVVLNKLYAADAGFAADYQKNVATLAAGFAAGRIGAAQYAEALFKLTAGQKVFVDAAKGVAAEQQRAAEAAAREAREAEKQLQSLEDKARAMEDEVRYYGMTEGAIQRTIIARLEEERASLAQDGAASRRLAYLDAEIEKRQRLAAAADSKDALDANKRATEDMQKDWEKMHDQLSQSLTDALMDGGMDAGEALRRYFRTLVLRPIIQGTVDAGLSAIGFGGGSSGGAGSLLSAGNSVYGLFSGNTLNTLASSPVGGALGLSAAGLSMASVGGTTGVMAGGAFYPGAIGAMQGSAAVGSLSGIGSMLGSALPWIGGALAVASMLGAFDSGGGPKTEGGLVGTIGGGIGEYSSTGQKFFTGNGSDAYVQGFLTPLMTDIGRLAVELGGVADGLEIGLGFNSDPQGTSGDSVGGGVYKDGQQAYFHAFGGYARGSYATELATESKRVMLAALESLDLNDLADAYLDSLDIAGLTDEMASQSLALVATTDDIIAAFERVGFSAEDVTLDLINAMGGFDAAGQAVSAMSQALDQIAQSAASSTAMFADSIRSIQLDVLDPQGKYNYLDAEAARYRDVLASLSDPALIAEYAGRLNSTIMQAWGTLDGTQQQAKADEFISLLREADTLALSRYDVAKENVTAQAEAIAAAVKQAVAEAMAENVAASNAVVTAVNNGIDAHVSVNLTIDQIRGAEVGYAA